MGFYDVIYVFGIILAVCFGIMVVSGVLGCLGFGPAGIVALSCASAWQSTIGNVAKISLFAILQSIAALGYLANVFVLATVVAGATVVALIYYVFYYDGNQSSLINNSTIAIWNNVTKFSYNVTNNIKTDLEPHLKLISEKVSNFTENIKYDVKPQLNSISHFFTSIWNESRLNSSD